MSKRILTQVECEEAISAMVVNARKDFVLPIFGVPRGGIPVAYLLKAFYARTIIVDRLSQASWIVDDIVDSGKTKERYLTNAPKGVRFFALADFLRNPRKEKEWLVFPWEQAEEGKDTSAEDIVIRLLQYIGEDPERGGLTETPQRVLKAWKEWTSGYGRNPSEVLKMFEDGGETYNEMVIQRDLPFYSHCEHHLAPFFGTATIGYIPNKKVVGLSKLKRVLDIFAQRLQVQERLTEQVADALSTGGLDPKGVGVVIKARHMCMESRGVSCQGHHTVTSAVRGVIREDNKARTEFFSLAQA